MSRRRTLVLCIHTRLGRSDCDALLQNGYEVITVGSEREGLSALKSNAVDAVILEFNAADKRNRALVRRLKQAKPHVPILLVCPPGPIAPGALTGADAVVLSSDPPARLVRILDYLLNVRFPFFSRWFGNWKHRAGA